MRLMSVGFVVCFILYSVTAHAENQGSDISQITDNIMKVCDKPENAGSYWDIKVRADGEADIKLKLANLGVTGEVAFSKSEWEGIQRTVEDNKDYRDCVKILSPLFVEKFGSAIPGQKAKKETKRRILGGVKWQEVGAGLKITLSSCYRQSSSVVCEFIANSIESDSTIKLSEGSAVYDQRGNKYIPYKLTIANFKSSFREAYIENFQGELVKGVDTLITANFNNVDDNSVMVSKAMLIANIKQQGGRGEDHIFTFRNVKIALK